MLLIVLFFFILAACCLSSVLREHIRPMSWFFVENLIVSFISFSYYYIVNIMSMVLSRKPHYDILHPMLSDFDVFFIDKSFSFNLALEEQILKLHSPLCDLFAVFFFFCSRVLPCVIWRGATYLSLSTQFCSDQLVRRLSPEESTIEQFWGCLCPSNAVQASMSLESSAACLVYGAATEDAATWNPLITKLYQKYCYCCTLWNIHILWPQFCLLHVFVAI